MNAIENPAPGLSSVQAGVQIVQAMVQCGMNGAAYEGQSDDLFGLMQSFAMDELRNNHQADIVAAGYRVESVDIEDVTHDSNENTPMALAYWAATSVFFRKVYQAAASAA